MATKPYKLSPRVGEYLVVDRESGRTVGHVEWDDGSGPTTWIARDVDERTIDGPCAHQRFRTRAEAADAVWAGRDLDDQAAEDVLEDQSATEEMLDAAYAEDDSALIAQLNDTGSL